MKTLPTVFYTMPDTASTSMDRKDLKEVLLSTDGKIVACGALYDIKSSHLGAGVYQVKLKRTNP